MPHKPSEKEQEYFVQQELEQIRNARRKAAKETAEKELQRLKELHWMRCPKCGMELSEIDFRGVMVDTCFHCGGVFFDQGEVQKVLDQENAGVLRRVHSKLFGSKGS